jgi:hypothetical protein
VQRHEEVIRVYLGTASEATEQSMADGLASELGEWTATDPERTDPDVPRA